MKKLLLLAAIAVTMFACVDKPETETDINYLKGNIFGSNNSGRTPYKLYFVDNNTVYMYYCSAEHYYIDSITYTEDSVLYLTYSIYQTIRDSIQSFYIGLSNNEQLISDTVGRGNLYLSDTKDSYEIIIKDELHLYRDWRREWSSYNIYSKQ
jgi:hypothetical protein